MEDTPFLPVDPTRISEKVAEAISQAIVDGKLSPGENLPPERKLAELFNVTRNTVREALRQVESSGLISVRQGSGITVNDYKKEAGVEAIKFLTGMADRVEVRRDVAVFRIVIGQALVFYAIDVMKPESLKAIREAIDEFCEEAEKPEPNVVRLQEIDFEIHRRFIQAGKNQTMLFIHNTIRHTYRKTMKLFEALMEDPLLIAQYFRETIEALEAGDNAAAKEALEDYFQYGYSVLTES